MNLIVAHLVVTFLSVGFTVAQCPPDVIYVFILNDRTIHGLLTEPLCLACRFFTNQGNFLTFSDGVWRKGSTVLNDGDFNGNVNLSSTSDTMFMTLEYPDDVVNVGDTITCSSSTAAQQNIITFGDFVILNPVVSPNGTANIIEGSNLTLTCSDPGNTGNAVRYVWINDSDGRELTPVINNPPLILNLINIDRAASGNYTCRSTHIDLPGINREFTVTVNVQPLSLPSVYIQKTEFVIINCTYETYDSSIDHVKWEHNDSLLDPNSDPYITVITQSSYSELTISSLTQQYVGAYQCIVTNGAGSVKSGKVNVTTESQVSSLLSSIYSSSTTTTVISIHTTKIQTQISTLTPTCLISSCECSSNVVVAVSSVIVSCITSSIVTALVALIISCYFHKKSINKSRSIDRLKDIPVDVNLAYSSRTPEYEQISGPSTTEKQYENIDALH